MIGGIAEPIDGSWKIMIAIGAVSIEEGLRGRGGIRRRGRDGCLRSHIRGRRKRVPRIRSRRTASDQRNRNRHRHRDEMMPLHTFPIGVSEGGAHLNWVARGAEVGITCSSAMTTASKLILASGSPRRRELLTRARIDFEVVQSGIEEVRAPHESAREYALRMAREKALAVSARHLRRNVLAADTVVECDAMILEKPVDATDATRMLNALSGRTHTVVTAFAIASNSNI